MIKLRMPDSSVQLSLKYNGTAVDGGSMPISEVVAALQGFAGVYGKVSTSLAPESTHELRVTAVRQGSFELQILAWLTSVHGVTALHAVESVGKAAGTVFGIIKGYIELKKFLKGDGYEITIGDGNTKLIINRSGESREVPKEVIALLQSKTLDSDLKKIVSPLDEGAVDSVEITTVDESAIQQVSVSSEEKSYFGESSLESSRDFTVIGSLVSNNKETRRGTFDGGQGVRVPYHYVGDDPNGFQSVFAFSGAVRVSGVGHFDENDALKGLDITEARTLQTRLGLEPDKQDPPPSSSVDQDLPDSNST